MPNSSGRARREDAGLLEVDRTPARRPADPLRAAGEAARAERAADLFPRVEDVSAEPAADAFPRLEDVSAEPAADLYLPVVADRAADPFSVLLALAAAFLPVVFSDRFATRTTVLRCCAIARNASYTRY